IIMKPRIIIGIAGGSGSGKTTLAENIENNMIEDENPVDAEEAIEAILFAAGHPISYATLARVLNLTPGKVRDIVADYSFKYNSSEFKRGVILLTYQDSCQLCTKKNYLPEIREALGIRKSGTLSTSSMEALAIVAYNQPVTRVFVDTLRRADSSYAMNNLLDRGLIECKGRLDVPGRPMLYGTTHDFLRSFGLDSLDSLPATTEELIAVFENAKTDTGLDPAAFEAQNEGLINEATATQKTIDDIEGELEAEATVEAVSEDVTELDDMGADDDLANDIE
ncbi:MAG: SMC-Scp complex subunit ScpB, partial [Clostridia bacterium]|nr:SMC-Scp complex subunit ScpB [Clostridia bacterium]